MENNELTETENLFLALADKTRLRIVNLMRGGEVCVNLFSDVLIMSQPKISRHLAYLRNAGVVSTRRHGKWVYYRIDSSISSGATRVLNETLDWLASQNAMQTDYERLTELNGYEEKAKTGIIDVINNYERDTEIETFLL